MKVKDALVGLMIWLLALVIAFSASIESAPIWAVFILGVLVWIIYIFVIIREYRIEKNRPKPLVWLEVRGEWRAIDGDGQLIPRDKTPPNPQIYDQEEDEG